MAIAFMVLAVLTVAGTVSASGVSFMKNLHEQAKSRPFKVATKDIDYSHLEKNLIGTGS